MEAREMGRGEKVGVREVGEEGRVGGKRETR